MEGCGAPEIGYPILGLFGEIGTLGRVKDLGLTRVSARGRGGRGGIGGMLCAVNRGSIERCYCAGVLGGYGEFGGLVGRNVGAIQDCYARGGIREILGTGAYHAGLVGWNQGGAIRTCYATCSVPPHRGAGLIGVNGDGSVASCLWDVVTSGVISSAGGTGLNTEALMSVQVLQSYGWGGSPHWIVDDGNDYPRLLWEGTPGSLIPEPETEPQW